MAVVSCGKVRVWILICSLCGLLSLPIRLDGSVATRVHYHSPNLQAWALNTPKACIAALFRGVQNNSITVIPDVVRVWSSPFLPTLMNSLTNYFELFTFNMRCTWWLFYEEELHLSATPAATHKCCVSKEPRSVRQQQCAIRRNHSFTP